MNANTPLDLGNDNDNIRDLFTALASAREAVM